MGWLIAALVLGQSAIASAGVSRMWTSVNVEGKPRWYHTYEPADTGTQARPLVLVFHPYASSAQAVMSGGASSVWKSVSDRDGVYLAYLNGTGIGLQGARSSSASWNDCERRRLNNASRADDVAFARAVVKAMKTRHGSRIDSRRVYAYGFSNGGMMALRLGREAGDEFAAVASVAGVDPAANDDECSDGARVSPALIKHGSADRIVPFENVCGASSACRLGHHRTVLQWTERTASSQPGASLVFQDLDVRDNSHVQCEKYFTPEAFIAGGAPHVQACVVHGGGHVQASILTRIGPVLETLFGKQNRDVESAEEAWQFLQHHRLP